MSIREFILVLLLIVGVAIELFCCLAVALIRGAFSRLHYIGPATSLGPLIIVTAVVVANPLSLETVKVVLILLALMISGPMLTHATARAAYLREHGNAQRRQRESAAPAKARG